MKTQYRRRTGIREQAVGAERMIFDDSAESVHVLNGSAAFIWDCLKEPVSAARIEALLREEYDMSAVPDVPAVIGHILQDFATRKLVEPAPQEGAGMPAGTPGGA